MITYENLKFHLQEDYKSQSKMILQSCTKSSEKQKIFDFKMEDCSDKN